jgi:hypothetical protein
MISHGSTIQKALKMEAQYSSETLISTYKYTWRYTPEGPEDGGSIFLRKVGIHVPVRTALDI